MHCPRSSPSLARPPASASTRCRRSPHVQATSSPFVRTNTSSARFAAVIRNASANVPASVALRVAVPDSMLSPPARLPEGKSTSADAEALAGQPSDVVGEADEEDEQDEHDADDARPFHDREGDRAAADLLGERKRYVPAVERQEGEEVDDAERQ